jgi:hypothetical protein
VLPWQAVVSTSFCFKDTSIRGADTTVELPVTVPVRAKSRAQRIKTHEYLGAMVVGTSILTLWASDALASSPQKTL